MFGPVGLMLASVYLILQRIMMWSEEIAIFSGVSDKKATLKKVVTHPCVLACFIGFILMVGQIKLPAVILTPIQTLGRCNTALSMMVIGMILANIDVKTILDKKVIRNLQQSLWCSRPCAPSRQLLSGAVCWCNEW